MPTDLSSSFLSEDGFISLYFLAAILAVLFVLAVYQLVAWLIQAIRSARTRPRNTGGVDRSR